MNISFLFKILRVIRPFLEPGPYLWYLNADLALGRPQTLSLVAVAVPVKLLSWPAVFGTRHRATVPLSPPPLLLARPTVHLVDEVRSAACLGLQCCC